MSLGLPDDNVRCLAQALDGRIFIGTATGLATWAQGFLRSPEGKRNPKPEPVNGLVEGGGDGMWVLSGGRLARMGGDYLESPVNGAQWNGLAASYADNLWLYGEELLRVTAEGLAGPKQQVDLDAGDAITALCERSSGEVWFGTRSGLVRRQSGGQGKSYRLFAGKGSRHIRCIFEDMERNLWIGTEGGGLVRLKPKRVLTFGTFDGLPGETITSLCRDGSRTFWVGCHKDGIAYGNAGTFTRFTANGALPDNMIVWSLRQTRDGSLWIGTEGAGLLRWREGKLDRFGPEHGITESAILTICGDAGDGVFFGGRDGGLYHWTEEEGVHYYGTADGMDGTNISSLVPGNQGVWIGSNQNGLYWFNKGGFTRFTVQDGLGSNFVRTLYLDGDGVLWIGTAGGVTRRKGDTFVHFSSRHGLWDNTISQIIEDGLEGREGGQNLWFGSNHGVFRIRKASFENLARGKVARLQPVIYGRAEGMDCLECTGGFGPSGLVENLTPNPAVENPRLWFPTLRGLISMDAIPLLGRTEGIMGDHLVFSRAFLHLGPDGIRFDLGDVVAGGDGFGSGTACGIDLLKGTPVNDWISANRIDPATLAENRYHRTSLPFIDGVFIPDGNVVTGHMVSVSSSGLKAELPGTNGAAWGFLKSGVRVPPEELADAADLAKLGPRFLWMPGNQGITFSLDAVRKTTGRSVERFTSDVVNLHIGSASYHVLVDGNLVSRRSGLVRDSYQTLDQNSVPVDVILPEEAQYLTLVTTDNKDDPGGSNQKMPPVIIEELREDGQLLDPVTGGASERNAEPKFVIAPGNGSVEIRFTALSLVAAEKVRFRYKLEPLEKEWVESGNRRSAHYTHVPPGEYYFRVIACNNDGVWNETGAAAALVVKPRLWETWWFVPACIFFSATALATVVGLVIRSRHRRRMVLLQQSHALEQERSRIARDIHDDLGASLTNIGLLSELALSDLHQPASARQHLDSIFTAAQRVARSVDEIVWAINPKNDAVERSLAYICKSAQDFLRPAGVQCRLDLPAEFPVCFLSSSVRHNLYLTVREVLNNVVKHSKARDVKLSLSVAAETLTFAIADSGCGFDTGKAMDETAVRHGLGNMNKRMEMINGRIDLVSRPQEGTVIRLTVPLSSNSNHDAAQ